MVGSFRFTGGLRAKSDPREIPGEPFVPKMILSRFFGGRDRYGNYEIIDPISEGGFSHVYRARRLDDGVVVALKLLKKDALPDPEKLERLSRSSEGEIATSLQHENVVRTYEYGKTGDDYYIAMEYVDGPNLRDIVREGVLSEFEKMDIIRQIGRGLEYIHSKGLIHRDFCPKNILLNDDGVAKIIDFGLSITARGKTSHLWERAGTASYMAPEQIRGNPGDYRADVYAFGVNMYEILTGRRPFEGDNRASKMQGHLNMDATPPTQFNEHISAGVEEVVMACLQKDPNKRPQTMTSVMNRVALAVRQSFVVEPEEEIAPPAEEKPLRSRRWNKGDIHKALGKAGL